MANTKITALTASGALTSDDLVPVVDSPASGATTKKATMAQVATFVIGSDAEISALAGLTSAADKVPVFSGSGTATTLDLKDVPSATNASALTWTAGTPITNVNSTYSWHRVGKFVHVRGNINGTAGVTVTNVSFPLPTDLPTPAKPTGVTGNLAACYDGYCNMRTSLSSTGNTGRCTLRTNSTDTGFEISCNASSGSHLQVVWEVSYQAA